MGRQIKKGIDYFSHDVNMKEDLKIKLLRAKFGLTGYAVYNLLLEDIYKDSYYLKIDEDYILLFSADNNIDESELKNIITFMTEKELFSLELYTEYSILTSERIQKNYLHSSSRRSETTLISKFLLTDVYTYLSENQVILVNVDKNKVNVDKNKVNDSNKTHSIVYNSIEENSIEEKRKEEKKLPPLKKLNVDEVIEGKTELPTKLVGNIQFDYIKNQWNEFANDNQLHTIMTLTNKRISNIKARLKESEFDFQEILKKIAESSFLLGANNRNWKIDFDFIFSSTNNYLKILENKYQSNGSKITNETKRERLNRNANAIESLIRNVTN